MATNEQGTEARTVDLGRNPSSGPQAVNMTQATLDVGPQVSCLVTVWTEPGQPSWMADHSQHPTASKVRQLFGTVILPTAIPAAVPFAKVRSELERLNPGTTVQLRSAQGTLFEEGTP